MSKRLFYFFWIIVLINAINNFALQLHYDEAYYWTWSRMLQFSYFDHPPMVAYLIRLTTIFGHNEFFVRLSAVICSTGTCLFIYQIAKKAFNQRAGEIALILALSWPIIQGTMFIITPDAPFLFFWSATLYFTYCAIFENKRWWYLAGILSGFGLLSKYPMVLIFPSVFMFLMFNKNYRNILKQKEIYIALILGFLIFLPVIYWNYKHDWISFKFQFGHGVSDSSEVNPLSILDYFGVQLASSNPFIFLGIVYFMVKYWRQNFQDSKIAFFVYFYLFVVLFFGYNALFKFQEGNWVAPAYISGIIFLAYYLDKLNIKWLYRVSIGIILVIYPFIKLPTILIPDFLLTRIQPIGAFLGNKEIILQLKPLIDDSTEVIACNYSSASRAWFYLGRQTRVLSEFKDAHNYQFWQPNLPIKKAVYICDSKDAPQILHKYFLNINYVGIYNYKGSYWGNVLYVYQADNFKK